MTGGWAAVVVLAIAALCLPAQAQDASDGASAACPKVWPQILAPGPQLPLARDMIAVGDSFIFVLHFEELVGEYAKKYAFLKYQGPCISEAVVLGSYAWSVADDPPDGPRTHVLHYYSEDLHATMDVFQGDPGFEEIDKRARATLIGDEEAQ